jgi:hypothetical protein
VSKVTAGRLAGIAALVLACAGCGVSQYNSLIGQRLAALRSASKFEGLYAPTQIPGTPFSIRVPQAFEHSYEPNSSHEDDGGPISPDRLQPPFLKLPGLKVTYEGKATSSAGASLPFYCYLAVQPSQPGGVDKLVGQLEGQLKEKFPKAVGAWQPVDAETPEGRNVHWRSLRIEADQQFFVKSGEKAVPGNMPAIFELWVHDAETHVVIVGWRAPKSIDGPSEGVAVKPDLSTMPAKTAGTLTSEAAPAE